MRRLNSTLKRLNKIKLLTLLWCLLFAQNVLAQAQQQISTFYTPGASGEGPEVKVTVNYRFQTHFNEVIVALQAVVDWSSRAYWYQGQRYTPQEIGHAVFNDCKFRPVDISADIYEQLTRKGAMSYSNLSGLKGAALSHDYRPGWKESEIGGPAVVNRLQLRNLRLEPENLAGNGPAFRAAIFAYEKQKKERIAQINGANQAHPSSTVGAAGSNKTSNNTGAGSSNNQTANRLPFNPSEGNTNAGRPTNQSANRPTGNQGQTPVSRPATGQNNSPQSPPNNSNVADPMKEFEKNQARIQNNTRAMDQATDETARQWSQGNYIEGSRPLAMEMARQGNAAGAYGTIAVGTGLQIFSTLSEDKRRADERKAQLLAQEEERERIRMEEERIRKERHAMIVRQRKLLVNAFDTSMPIPLASANLKADRIYYFVYIVNPNELEAEQATFYVSNVFEIAKFNDGTWPYQKNIDKEVKALSVFPPTMHGYYLSANEAEAMRARFISSLKVTGDTKLVEINYEGKPNTKRKPTPSANKEAEASQFGVTIKTKNGSNVQPSKAITPPQPDPKPTSQEDKFGKTLKIKKD